MGSFTILLDIYVHFVQASNIDILGQIISKGEFFLSLMHLELLNRPGFLRQKETKN